MRKNFIVSTDDVSRTRALADELRSAGMDVENVMEEIGVVSGSMPEEKAESVAQMPGVTVEESRDVQIPPPDSDVQ